MNTKIVYKGNIKLLNEIIDRDKAILEREYQSKDIKDREFNIEFICSCGENKCEKSFVSIVKGLGAFCKKCVEISRVNNFKKSKTKTSDEYIEQVNTVHQNKYTYDYLNYIDPHVKVIITCSIHGNFEQSANAHLRGQGCPKCAGVNNKTTDEFIEQATEAHKGKYSYDKVVYTGAHNPVIITCKEHGDFTQTPHDHYKSGCSKCSNNNIKKTTDEFIEQATEAHKGKYSYEKIIYKNTDTSVIITCKEHGDFEQTPYIHLRGRGCPKCGVLKMSVNKRNPLEIFILKSTEVHKGKYSYDKVVYTGAHNPVIITCKEHGDFNQRPSDHQRGQGCKRCSSQKQYSEKSITWLNLLSKKENIHIQYFTNEGEFKIPDSKYSADGYCKETKTIYEFHGCYWHGCPNCYKDREEINKRSKNSMNKLYEQTQKKKQFCIEKGYNYIEIWECEYDLLLTEKNGEI
jgi:hypothetical protein